MMKMMSNSRHILLFMTSLCLWACEGRNLQPDGPLDVNTPIVLAMEGMDNISYFPQTKTVTDHLSYETVNLPDGTHLFMYMQSDYDTQEGAVSFAGATATKYCQTRGVINTTTSSTLIQFVDEDSKTRTRYWEDAHARCSRLSIFAIGAPGMSYIRGGATSATSGAGLTAITEPNVPWSTTENTSPVNITSIDWNVPNSGQQDKYFTDYFIKNRDLIYSNNISDQSSNTELEDALKTDRRLKFNTGSKTFEHGTLTFYHALSKITVKIKKGEGFLSTEPFAFTVIDGIQNIKLNKFNIWGKFDVKQGKFTALNTAHASIMGMWNNADKPEGITYQLEALVLPYDAVADPKTPRKGSLFSSTESSKDDYLMEFYIDNNKYQITSAQLFNAIKDVSANNIANDATEIHVEPGMNYEFTILVDKSKISGIEAKIIPWETVTATADPSNSHVTLSLKNDAGSAVSGGGFSLYRAPGAEYTGADYQYNSYAVYDWEKGYEGPAANVTESGSIYDTEWYWPNNKTFYHFRTLKPTGQTLNNNTGDDAITSVAIQGGTLIQVDETPASAVDYQWGAPFKSGASLGYSHETGFCNNASAANGQLYKAIGATDNVIAITQLHMTSQVFVDLETSTTGTDNVVLTGATVQFTNLATSANLQLGNGLVTGHGSYSDVTITPDAHVAADGVPAYDYSYGVLPQKLTGNGSGTDKVGIVITLADGNQYTIEDLSKLTTTVSGNKQAVETWNPGKKYYYKFKLTKTAIEPLHATIKDWESVSANYDDVKIE